MQPAPFLAWHKYVVCFRCEITVHTPHPYTHCCVCVCVSGAKLLLLSYIPDLIPCGKHILEDLLNNISAWKRRRYHTATTVSAPSLSLSHTHAQYNKMKIITISVNTPGPWQEIFPCSDMTLLPKGNILLLPYIYIYIYLPTPCLKSQWSRKGGKSIHFYVLGYTHLTHTLWADGYI